MDILDIKDIKEELGQEDEMYIVFKQDDLFNNSFPQMKEIRRQGKLCDVTLIVIIISYYNI